MSSRLPTQTRLTIVSPGIPHSTKGASTVLFFHYIYGLKKAGFEILNVLLLPEGTYAQDDLTEYISRMSEPGKFEVVVCQAPRFEAPKSFSLKLKTALLSEVRSRVGDFRPDVVLAFDLLSARVAKCFKVSNTVVWLGDLNFQTFWYHAWYEVKERPLAVVHLPMAWIRSWLWKKIYRKALRDVKRVIVASKSSEVELARLGISAVYLPYPWPNDSQERMDGKARKEAIPTFLFYGTLTGLGSRSGLHFLVRSLYPRLLRLWGQKNFKILIAGSRDLPDWVKAECSAKPELLYLGFVKDLDGLMASCHAVICPMDVPVGNRSRIVTAMAKRALVIAHPNTAMGNPGLVHNATCYLASTPEDFVRCMKKAFERSVEVEAIIDNARCLYEQQFAPDVAVDWLLQHVRAVMPDRSVPSRNLHCET
jgi:hypothetical protein